MRLHRFIEEFNLTGSVIEISDVGIVNQIQIVLRLKVGEKIILGDGNLNEVEAEVTELGKKSVTVKIVKKYQNQNEPGRNVSLCCAILKRENFELVAQKATEVGVAEIIPIITERTVKTGLNLERLRKIIHGAAEQSGRGILPIIREPIQFKKAINNQNGINILFHTGGTLPSDMYFSEGKVPRITIWIGPEGGFSESEVNLAKEMGFQIASLGALTLRAETAAIVASYLTIYK